MSLVAGGVGARFVVIGGVQLAACWVMCENVWVLERSMEIRGSDRLVPHLPGTRPKPRRATVTKETLGLVVTGEVTLGCAASTDPEADLDANMAYLRAQAVDPADAGGFNLNTDGTRDAELHLADGGVAVTTVHTGPLHIGSKVAHAYVCTLDLSFPFGGFVLS